VKNGDLAGIILTGLSLKGEAREEEEDEEEEDEEEDEEDEEEEEHLVNETKFLQHLSSSRN
jgi:hypothetical protein